MPSVRLFVYGSLKRSGLHHRELAGARFLGEAETKPGHVLTTLGDYWALSSAAESPNVVRGELFEVPEQRLPALDELEGELYERRALSVRLRGGKAAAHSRDFLDALAYFEKAR